MTVWHSVICEEPNLAASGGNIVELPGNAFWLSGDLWIDGIPRVVDKSGVTPALRPWTTSKT